MPHFVKQSTEFLKHHSLPQSPDEYEAYLSQKFSRIIESQQFLYYEGFLDDYYRVPKPEDDFPGWVLPMRDDDNDSISRQVAKTKGAKNFQTEQRNDENDKTFVKFVDAIDAVESAVINDVIVDVAIDSATSATRAAGVPSRSEGAAALGNVPLHRSRLMLTTFDSPSDATSSHASNNTTTTLPPITNRGATLYRNKSQSNEQLCTSNNYVRANNDHACTSDNQLLDTTNNESLHTTNTLHDVTSNTSQQNVTSVWPRKNAVEIEIDDLPCPHIMGGYDGGVELGFDGKWPDKTFERVIATLEAGRTAAQQKHNDARFISLGGRQFLVQPHGGGKAVNYRYIIEGDGIKFYFHHKPDGGIQPIRLRYGFESLIGCNLFRVHNDTLDWLNKLGFVIEKETLSRVDLQVMIHREVSEFLRPIASGHMVTKVRKWGNHGTGSSAETFKIGSDIEVCIYDKATETLNAMVSAPIKFGLMQLVCFGQDWCFNFKPVTRVEFRLRRDALKVKGINTMRDLQEIEPALVEWLTTKWFRILVEPKIRGHENMQEILPAWQEVQQLFKQYFPGINGVRREIPPNRKRLLSCEATPLIKQAGGCLATAIALQYGQQPSRQQLMQLVNAMLETFDEKLLARTNERAQEFQTKTGVRADP